MPHVVVKLRDDGTYQQNEMNGKGSKKNLTSHDPLPKIPDTGRNYSTLDVLLHAPLRRPTSSLWQHVPAETAPSIGKEKAMTGQESIRILKINPQSRYRVKWVQRKIFSFLELQETK